MKIYFGFTVAGDRSGLEAARTIVRVLEELGHEVLTRHLIDDNAWEADRRVSAQEVYHGDIGLAGRKPDVHCGSVGVVLRLRLLGRLHARVDRKESCLYRRDLEHRVSLVIRGNSHSNCTLAPYSDAIEAEALIREVLKTPD
jgi:hypothetical protein